MERNNTISPSKENKVKYIAKKPSKKQNKKEYIFSYYIALLMSLLRGEILMLQYDI